MHDLPDHPECWPVTLRERFEERAAFHEFDAGMTREEAEAKAEKAIRKAVFLAGVAAMHEASKQRVLPPAKSFARAAG